MLQNDVDFHLQVYFTVVRESELMPPIDWKNWKALERLALSMVANRTLMKATEQTAIHHE